jgi:aldehyde dehydrogenase (NAD(P)+)
MPWGGHPSANLRDVQSGLGWVHNTFMLEGIDKSVLRGPLTVKPTPIWFTGVGKAARTARKLIRLEAEPSWLKLPGIIWSAL